jgi:hypothetical protein
MRRTVGLRETGRRAARHGAPNALPYVANMHHTNCARTEMRLTVR